MSTSEHGGSHYWQWPITEQLSVHGDTICGTLIVMGVLTLFAYFLGRDLKKAPTSKQSLLETIYEFLEGVIRENIGEKGVVALPFLGTLFLFILTSNWMGAFPWAGLAKLFGIPEIKAPSTDLNTTVGLALLVSLSYFYLGIRKKGLGYFAHYIPNPRWLTPILLPIHIIEDIARPLSLSIRLFGNITAEHVVVAILTGLIPFVPFIIPLPMIVMGLFFGFIQAYIFTVLASSYIGTAMEEHH